MDMSHLEPRASGLDRPSPEADALTRIAKAVGGGNTTRMAGTFSAPQTYNADVNFTRAQQAGAARRTQPQMQPMQFDAAQERVQRMQRAASQYAPETEQPDVHVTVDHPQHEPQPGSYQPAPQPTRTAPERQPQAPAQAPPARGTQAPQARGQVFTRQPGDVSSPYADRVAASRPETVSATPGQNNLGGQFGEMPVFEQNVAVHTYQSPRGIFESNREPGEVGTGWPGEQETAEDNLDSRHEYDDIPGSRSTGTGWPGSAQRSSSVSATPARGSLGGQFGEPGAADMSQQPASPGSMRSEIARRTSGHYGTGRSVLDEMGPARRGVSDAIRAAGTDIPEALF